MRLFLAIDPDEAARSVLAEVLRSAASRLEEGASALRWVAAEQAHLTLHFLGDVDADRSRRLMDAVRVPCEVRPFRVALDHFGVFPPAGPARTVWLGVGEGGEAVRTLHAVLGRRLTTLGFPIEDRPYSPHLTVARVRDSERHRARLLRETLVGLLPRPVTWHVTQATLIQSDLSGPRPRYTALAALLLKDPGPRTPDDGLRTED